MSKRFFRSAFPSVAFLGFKGAKRKWAFAGEHLYKYILAYRQVEEASFGQRFGFAFEEIHTVAKKAE